MQKSIQNILSRFLAWRPNNHALKLTQIALSVFVFLLFFSSNPPPLAQETSLPGETRLVKSMGLPRIWKPYFGPMIAWDRRSSNGEIKGELNAGIYKDLSNPLLGLLGIVGEGYLRLGSDTVDGGVRILGANKLLFIQGGVEYSFRNKETDFLMSLLLPLRRGGPFKRGGSLRIDWFPRRNHSFSIGLSIPVGQPFLGKSRPAADYVSLPKGSLPSKLAFNPNAELKQALANVRHAAVWINRFTTPFLDQSAKKGKSDLAAFTEMIDLFKKHIHTKDDVYLDGHTFVTEVIVYHQELEKAFSLATRRLGIVEDLALGVLVAGKAREIILKEVIVPYNRLLGQRKRHDSVLGLGLSATETFKAWTKASSEIPIESRDAVMRVFLSIIQYIDENRAASRKVWEDSRLVWIPMHYALRFEDHDTEDELDTIIEMAVSQKFTHENDVHYIVNELFQPELERTIHQAEDYHVLWIHDFRGVNKAGAPDTISYRQTVNSYLKALTARVKAYNTTRKIPDYMIFLDQIYFELSNSRLWLKLLEDPLGHEVHLPPNFRNWEVAIRKSQEELRAAVSQSCSLQFDAQRFGKEWLSNQIKVHINVTNRSDFSFRSGGLIKYLHFIPDNIMRDHRKIAFYDVTELDPAKGEAIYTGMGVGENYVGPTWDDRGILARGPVLVSLKDAARDLLLSQGFGESEIPMPLRQVPTPDNYADMLKKLHATGWTASAMQVHNATGFGPKSANIIKAILYNLMPNGSHLYVPDALWNSPFWGAMLIGAALRGCVVLVVCPALENSPSPGGPQMSRANELFTRFLIIQKQLRDEIDAAGGVFKVGIYNMDFDVGDIAGKVRALSEGVAKSDEFRKIFPFAPSVVDIIAKMPEILESEGFKPLHLADDVKKRKPQLHLKAQFFASKRAINTIVPLKEWEAVVRKYIIERAKQVADRETDVDAKALREELNEEVATLIAAWSAGLSQKEREEAILYLTVGSHNQDYRSMIMDGEVLFIVGRTWAMVAYLDFVSLLGQTTWVDDIQQLEQLLPRQSGFWRWLGKYLKLAL